MTKSIGVTIYTPDCEALKDEAMRRFQRFTGLECEAVAVETKQEAHRAKLSLKKDCWFFDCDLWFVREVVLPELRPGIVYGTPVNPGVTGFGIIQQWATRAQVDARLWISSGIFGGAWGADDCALHLARKHADNWHIRDRDEESLNVGFQRAGLTIGLLPSVYNWHPVCGCAGYGYEPPDVFVIHAGGVPMAEKLEFLRRHC